LALAGDFAWSCWRKPEAWVECYGEIRKRRYFKYFIYCKEASFPAWK
jgi:hypothetical protein